MSRDQRPGRVRVISSGRPPEPPQRRRGDVDANPNAGAAGSADEAMPGAVRPMVAAAAAPAVSRVMLVLLFVIGCGLGGGLIAALGLFDVGIA
ncbi:hypothetical protein [Sphingomonas sp. DBB INV C78]|uniref:hypothetical protein n=1 Tax=Sphingomonas sp. DBB INV C78 TaxID=3349434 RepID=UPI0036D26667